MHNSSMWMNWKSEGIWRARAVAFLVAALAAASAGYWMLQSPDTTPAPDAPASASTAAPTDPAALTRLFGESDPTAAAAPAGNAAAGRFVLMGVVADTSSGGTALISIDGKPARTFPVGSRVDQDLILQSVAPRRAVLATSASAPASMTLEMKPLPR